MDFERMWKELKTEIQQQQQLSENITIIKLLARIEEIEEAEKNTFDNLSNDGELLF